jgi:hypothetical protein
MRSTTPSNPLLFSALQMEQLPLLLLLLRNCYKLF